MPAIITYTPQAPLNNFQAVHAPRLQAMQLQRPMLDTVTPQVAARAGAQLGAALTRRGEELQNAQNAATALQNLQEAEKDFITFENDYRQNTKRAAAANAPQDYDAFMQGKKQEYLEKLKDSPAAARLFELQFSRRQMDAVRSAGHYAHSEDEAHRSEVASGEVASLMQRAAQTDDLSAVATLRSETKAKLTTLLPGRDLTANFAKLDGDLAESLINRKIAQEDFSGANSLLQQFRGELGGRYDETLGRVKNSQRSAAAYYEAQHEKALKKEAVVKAQSLVQQFGGDSQQAQDWINSHAQSSEERLRLTSAYLTQKNVDDAMQQQVRQESYINTQSQIKADIESAGKDAIKLNEVIATAPPEHQQYALAHAEQAIGKQRRAISDPEAFEKARRAIITAGTDFALIEGEFAGKLSDADSTKLKALSEDKEAKQAAALGSKLFDALFKSSKYQKLDAGKRSEIYAQLKYQYAERTQDMRTTKDFEREAIDLLHDRVVSGSVWGTNTVTSAKALSYPQDKVRFAVPDKARQRIVTEATAKGQTLTQDQIEALYLANIHTFVGAQ